MSLRMDIELTSQRDPDTWTWRKAGARQPKGELDATVLHATPKVGDVLSVEYANTLDGIDIVAVIPTKDLSAPRHQTIELIGQREPDQLVTTTLVPKGRTGRRDRDRDRDRERDGDRRNPRRGAGAGRGPRDDRREGRSRGDAAGGERSQQRGPRSAASSSRRPTAPAPERPRPKRLRPGRAHRNAVLAALPPEQRPVAEQAARGGLAAVRQAVERQNETNRERGLPEIEGSELLMLAERLLPDIRLAEWRDRADAAVAQVEEVDLRDLRMVVSAATDLVRDPQGREIAETLRVALARRADAEHAAWLEELRQLIDGGRVVRALRVSSRPPKAGVPLPAELVARLVAGTQDNLTTDTSQERWATVLDALSQSPVRAAVTPATVPAEINDELRTAVAQLADRLPQIAALLGVEAAKRPRRSGGGASGPRRAARSSGPRARSPQTGSKPADTSGGSVPDAQENQDVARTAEDRSTG